MLDKVIGQEAKIKNQLKIKLNIVTIVTKNSHHNKNMQPNDVSISGIHFSVDNTFN